METTIVPVEKITNENIIETIIETTSNENISKTSFKNDTMIGEKTINIPIIGNLKIEYLFDKLMLDPEFTKRLQVSINNIMKDGKIDQYDIPDMIFIITDILNQPTSMKIAGELSADDIGDLVKTLYRFIVKKYNIIPDETQADNFNRLMESSIRLLMLQPKIKKACNFFLHKFKLCCN